MKIFRKKYESSNITFDYNFDYGIQIMSAVKNMEHFNYWIGAYLFYNSVQKEGVELYAT